jgi:hypothetical protein
MCQIGINIHGLKGSIGLKIFRRTGTARTGGNTLVVQIPQKGFTLYAFKAGQNGIGCA